MERIFSDAEVFDQIKDKSRKAYIRSWQNFKEFLPNINFEEGPPAEDDIISFFRHLRQEKKAATSSLWTIYSYVNSVLKRKYGVKLQDLPRVTLFLKGFDEDTKVKAAIFDEALLKKFLTDQVDSSYWEVRQAIAMTAYFGGLRLTECLDLQLEKFNRGEEGFIITHSRAKQRTDKKTTRFLIPEEGGYARQLGVYIDKVKNQLEKFQGRVWFTAKKEGSLTSQFMGKNTVCKVPHEIAELLSLPDPSRYTFHSFRRTSATSAADSGATTEQLVDFFGWKNGSMCQEYISSSKPAILGMASRLGSSGEVEKVPSNQVFTKIQQEEMLTSWEEDPDMYMQAGIPCGTSNTDQQGSLESTVKQGIIESTVKQAMASVPAVPGSNFTMKVVVINNNSGTVNL